MNDEEKTKITRNLPMLTKSIVRLPMLISELVSKDVISFEEADAINAQTTMETQHATLFRIVLSKESPKTYQLLLKSFKASGNGHLIANLEDT